MRDSVTHRLVKVISEVTAILLKAAEWSEIRKAESPQQRLNVILEGITLAERRIQRARDEVLRAYELETRPQVQSWQIKGQTVQAQFADGSTATWSPGEPGYELALHNATHADAEVEGA